MKSRLLWSLLLSAAFVLAVTTTPLSAQTTTTLASFDQSDGDALWGPVIQGTDGNFYGTTELGGPNNSSPCFHAGCGTVFQVTPTGTLTTLHNFKGDDGYDSQSGLLQASDGTLYGSTTGGGSDNLGTIFKITTEGVFASVYSFAGQDGATPWGQLIQAKDGNFYGTTTFGGVTPYCPYYGGNGCGTVFKISPSGTLSTKFCSQPNCTDGVSPGAGLIVGPDGNFYGTTTTGGDTNPKGFCGVGGCGTVFKITPAGVFTNLHDFNGNDGYQPESALLLARDGNFYGTTSDDASPREGGTVFKITPSGKLTTLYYFCSLTNCADGARPQDGLVQATDGNFYGTTNYGGNCLTSCGTVFKVTPNGKLTTLAYFDYGGPGPAQPYAGLIQIADGNLYGTTLSGGTSDNCGYPPPLGCGTVYMLALNSTTLAVSTIASGSITSGDGFINCPGTCSHSYPDNTQVTLNASPAQGWSLASWSGACSGTGSCKVAVNQNLAVTATFTQNNYSLTVSTSGDGTVTSTDGFINCPGTCSHTYLSNTQVTLNASPAEGWSLSTWGGACSGNNQACNVTMTGTESVSATFTQNSYTLTASVVGQGTVTSTDSFISCPGTCAHTYLSLTQVTLNATPASGWAFSGWTGACMGVGSCNVTMTQNFGLTGVFVQPGDGMQFTPLTPCRLIDTRQKGSQPLQANTTTNFALPQEGTCGATIPSNAAAYSLNVTAVPITTLAYLTIWPTGEAQPLVSLMNSPDGRIKANAAIVPAGSQDEVSIYVTDTTDVILDIDGYFTAPSSQTYELYPLSPCRVVDTRSGSGFPPALGPPALVAKQQRELPILSSSCLNGITNPLAYSFNITVVPNPAGQPLGYLTVWPSNQTQPVVSTLNNPTATVVANAAIVPADPDNGDIDVYAYNSTDLILDINGYFAAPGQKGLSLYTVAPCRVLDTRNNNGQPFMDEKTVNVVGSPCAPPSSAQAYVFNATVVPPGSMPYLTLWADGQLQPTVSTLNAYDGFITSNMAIVPTKNGSIDAYAAGLTHLILDISGYFAP